MARDKKKNNKELEAKKLEAERLALLALKKEQQSHYGLNRLLVGENIPMFLTEWYTKTAWSHEHPRVFTRDYLKNQFTEQNLIDVITDAEIEMYSNSILYNLVYAKNKLKLDNFKTCYLINLLFNIFINSDLRFSNKQYEFLEDIRAREEAEAEKELENNKKKDKKTIDKKKAEVVEEVVLDDESELDRSEIEVGNALDSKSYDQDLLLFKLILSKLCKSNPDLFERSQIANIVSYTVESYFNNFRLFNYCLTNDQTEENVYLLVSVDEPYVTPPLEQAIYLGKILTEEEKLAQKEQEMLDLLDQEKVNEEALLKERELAQLEYEEWMGLDEETVALIKRKLEETKKYMIENIDKKKEEFEEKAANSKVFKKKKK